jgi:hypothetical protein
VLPTRPRVKVSCSLAQYAGNSSLMNSLPCTRLAVPTTRFSRSTPRVSYAPDAVKPAPSGLSVGGTASSLCGTSCSSHGSSVRSSSGSDPSLCLTAEIACFHFPAFSRATEEGRPTWTPLAPNLLPSNYSRVCSQASRMDSRTPFQGVFG